MTANRSTHALGLILAGAAALSLGACVNLVPDEVYPIGVYQPVDPSLVADLSAPVEETIRTARSGDILLRQAVRNAAVLVLENEVEPDGNISLSVQERTLDLSAGDLFYAAVAVGQESALVACSEGRPAVHIPRLNPGASASGKICFELKAYDGDIDMSTVGLEQDSYTTDRFFFVIDGQFGLTETARPYQMMTRWDQQLIYAVAPPAVLKRVADALDGADAAPVLALRFVIDAGGAKIEPIYLSGDRPLPTDSEIFEIDASAAFPQGVTVDGATLEVLALTEGVLAYRILSGFDTAETFVMDLPD